jgi:hypothetical protein
MKIEKRNNIDLLLPFKIAVSSENWYKIQHILFSKGYEWRDSGKVLLNSYLKYIFIDENKKITLTFIEEDFNKHENKLLKEEDVICE